MNEHEAFSELLKLEAAGLLELSERAKLEAHLAGCPACARERVRWQRLGQALRGGASEEPGAVLVARTRALARARLEEVAERRWNRLVLFGLVTYGWALWVVILPVLPTGADWLAARLGLPWIVTTLLLLLFWWSFTWVIGAATLPLLRRRKDVAEGRVA